MTRLKTLVTRFISRFSKTDLSAVKEIKTQYIRSRDCLGEGKDKGFTSFGTLRREVGC